MDIKDKVWLVIDIGDFEFAAVKGTVVEQVWSTVEKRTLINGEILHDVDFNEEIKVHHPDMKDNWGLEYTYPLDNQIFDNEEDAREYAGKLNE